MPRVRDFPEAVRRVGWWSFIKRVYSQINEDNLLTWAAAMAYSWLFALFPFLIFLLTLVPYVPIDNKDRLIDEVQRTIKQSLPEDASEPINEQIKVVLQSERKDLMSTGIILALWAASGGMAMTMSALNTCYEVRETRPFYTARPLALLLTIAVATLILSILVLLPITSGITRFALRYLEARGQYFNPIIVLAWNAARWALALVLMITAIGLVYHFGPGVKKRFHWVTPGALFTIVVWILLGLGVRLYIDKFASASYNATYGAVGGVAILLLVFYLDSLVLLIGAEINSEADFALMSVSATTTAAPDARSDLSPDAINNPASPPPQDEGKP